MDRVQVNEHRPLRAGNQEGPGGISGSACSPGLGARSKKRPSSISLEDIDQEENPDDEERQGVQCDFSRRQPAVSDAHRYGELEPEPSSSGETELEPEVDLSFLERQRLLPSGPSVIHLEDHTSRGKPPLRSKKRQAPQIEWDAVLEELSCVKVAAGGTRGD
ncbi:hypothetical protein C8Q79DRAFT_1004629 [Trametes meyenii]|nr:hypothetical protein C8Q79DRAFT_1004629 [Trametes meyenii]